MYYKVILAVIIFSTTIEAGKYTNTEADLIQLEGYTYDKWRIHNSRMFSKNWKEGVTIRLVLDKLNKMNLFQHTPYFDIAMRARSYGRTSQRFLNYFRDSWKFCVRTTLLRKTKTLPENLFDILSDKNGCSRVELAKMFDVRNIFEPCSLAQLSIDKVMASQARHCHLDYRKSLLAAIRLVGKENTLIMANLMVKLDNRALNDFVRRQYDARPRSIELLSRGIASYLAQLNHPDLSEIGANNLAEFESLLEEVYNIEIKEPARKLCQSTTGIKGYFPWKKHKNLSPIERNKDTKFKKLIALENMLDFSCNIASFAYGSMRTRIWEHFFNLKLAY